MNGIISPNHTLGVAGPWTGTTALLADGVTLSQLPWDAAMRNNFTWKINFVSI